MQFSSLVMVWAVVSSGAGAARARAEGRKEVEHAHPRQLNEQRRVPTVPGEPDSHGNPSANNSNRTLVCDPNFSANSDRDTGTTG